MFFSIVTSCYNSSQTLAATYGSLLNQSFKDFEWILIDDCSSDSELTRDLILKFAEEAPFNVKYYFLHENHFGSKSIMKGCELANGKYIGILDHDDQYTPFALAEAHEILLSKIAVKGGIAGVVGRCVNEKKELIGPLFNENFQVSTEGEIRYLKKNLAEFVLFTRSDILQNNLLPSKPGFTLGLLWARISTNYKYIFVNNVFRIYDMSVPTSFSNTKSLNERFPEAKVEMIFNVWQSYSHLLHHQSYLTFREAIHTIYLILKYKIKPDYTIIKSWKVKVFLVVAFPFACLKYLIK